MKKAFMTLFAVAVSMVAMAQADVWVWKNGVPVKTSLADSITFAEPSLFSGDGIENGHAWVDLGLTSGTKWATCNVGATNPQGYGNYYAWGETTAKTTYSWSTYLDGNIDSYPDCGTSKDKLNGVTDIAGTEYDAANVSWGGKWRMPTYDQQTEILDECYWVWTDSYNSSSVAGYIVYKAKASSDKGVVISSGSTPSSSYSLSDAHIFLPAAGYRSFSDLYDAGSYGNYWASSLYTDRPYYVWYVSFDSDGVYNSNCYRVCGQSVRAVYPASE